jgi:hypothetical protein
MAAVGCRLVPVGVPSDKLKCFHKYRCHRKVKQDGGGQKFVDVSIPSSADNFKWLHSAKHGCRPKVTQDGGRQKFNNFSVPSFASFCREA